MSGLGTHALPCWWRRWQRTRREGGREEAKRRCRGSRKADLLEQPGFEAANGGPEVGARRRGALDLPQEGLREKPHGDRVSQRRGWRRREGEGNRRASISSVEASSCAPLVAPKASTVRTRSPPSRRFPPSSDTIGEACHEAGPPLGEVSATRRPWAASAAARMGAVSTATRGEKAAWYAGLAKW